MPEASFEVFQCHLKKKGGLGQIADKVQAVIFLPFLFLEREGNGLLPACRVLNKRCVKNKNGRKMIDLLLLLLHRENEMLILQFKQFFTSLS